MRTKLKKCLALLLILVTCFCILDNIFIGSGFFAKFIMPEAHAEDNTTTNGLGHYYNDEDVEPSSFDYQVFANKMVEVARSIAADTYHINTSSGTELFTYLWGGDGQQATGKNQQVYTVFDCRGLVSGSIRNAAKELIAADDSIKNQQVGSSSTTIEGLKSLYIGSTSTQFDDLDPKGFGCHRLIDESELQDGDILWRKGHTELFFRDGSKAMQVGACQTSKQFKKAAEYGGGYGTCEASESIKEYNFQGVGKWEAYFRIGTGSDYVPEGIISEPGADAMAGYLGSTSRYYVGPVDESANLDEQIFDFQGNPQSMIYEGETNFNMWLFTLLSQFLDFITGLLVSLLINPIMQLLNAIVNFLTNFINSISGLPTGN
jgi:hypothetical protein